MLFGVCAFMTFWFLIHLGYVLLVGLIDNAPRSDAAIVFGQQIRADGTPSQRLCDRLDRAVDVYRRGLAPLIIVSGRIDGHGHDEAAIMAGYLEQHGVPRSAIIEDNTGYTTFATAVNFRAIAHRHGIKNVIVISQYYHIARIRLAFHKAGIASVRHAHAALSPESRDFYYLPREFAGFYVYLFKK